MVGMNLELSFTMRVARIFEKREGLGTLLKCNSVCGSSGELADSGHGPLQRGPHRGHESNESLAFGVRWIGFKSRL